MPFAAYYEAAANWLKAQGLTTGYGGVPTAFAPDVTVSRAQMATFLWRLAGQPAAPAGGFGDVPAGAYYQGAANWLKATAITTGYGGPSSFAPDVTVSRAQMAAFLFRYHLATATRLTGATTVTGAYGHSCALAAAGTARCWGRNAHGQLGDGTATRSSIPVAVSGLTGATALSAGSEDTCAVVGGAVKCWGGGFINGKTFDVTTPTVISGVSGATAVSVGGSSACALVAGGAAKCWGTNLDGELGDGTGNPSLSGVAVSGLTGAVGISTSASAVAHTCAVLSAGTVKCWGNNAAGQLGNGTTTNSATPGFVTGITTATKVVAGFSHSCALLTTGAVSCWGQNLFGELGNGTTTSSSTPVVVSGVTDAVALTVGSGFTCAVIADGTVKCWGDNDEGRLGNGTTTDSPTAVPVVGVSGVTALGSGNAHSCAVIAGGAVDCWGEGFSGELGDGPSASSTTPVPVLTD